MLLQNKPKVRLFLLSFLILFLELSLIRYIPANIRLTSYFSNLVLLGTFLGIGIGFLLANFKYKLIYFFPFIVLFLFVILRLYKIEVDVLSPQVIYFKNFGEDGISFFQIEPIILLPIIFSLVALVFVPLAQELGRLFTKFKPLESYSIDILGAIVGIIVFSCFSYLLTPSYFWFGIAAVIFLLVLEKTRLPLMILMLFLLSASVLITFVTNEKAIWSPYYKITWQNNWNNVDGLIQINVNNIAQQFIFDSTKRKDFFYPIPYTTIPSFIPKEILIIGAGNGIDAATALKEDVGVKHIDAVEIDPVILALGKKLNPNKPYSDPRVTMHATDGREFLENTDKKYDLIVYALPDSLTLLGSHSNIRLESFLFTEEAFAQAKDHLSPNGMFILYNFYREQWLIDKIAIGLQNVFGEAPYVQYSGTGAGAATFFAGPETEKLNKVFYIKRFKPTDTLETATDDWPFIYLKERGVPSFYLKFIFAIGLISTLVTLVILKVNKHVFDRKLFFLGAGFMLLETKSLVTFAILFGNTWFVNSLVFTGILIFIFIANIIAQKVNFKHIWPFYILLFGFLAAAYIIPPSLFLKLPTTIRFVSATLFYFSPILFANLIFATLFKKTKDVNVSFASNMLGAVFGGLLEYVSLLTGYKFLLIIVAFFYFLSLITIPKIFRK